MKRLSYQKQIEQYQMKYGNIPENSDELLTYLAKELKLKEKDFEKIRRDDEYVQQLEWKELNIILPVIPKGCPRPRQSSVSGTFYVPGASDNKKIIRYYIQEKYQAIYTQTYFAVQCYLPTPMSCMSRTEIYRAENKTLIPGSNPDWDNLGKTYSDMIQSLLLLNDNLISKGLVEKFYSIKPRVEIHIKYQKGFDSKYNKRRMTENKSFRNAIEMGHIIELYTEGDDYW